MSSGEHQAVTPASPSPNPSSGSISALEPVVLKSSKNSDPAELETAERKKQSFASSFDQLVASNLRLVTSLDRLIRVSYVLLATSFLMWLAIVLLFFVKR